MQSAAVQMGMIRIDTSKSLTGRPTAGQPGGERHPVSGLPIIGIANQMLFPMGPAIAALYRGTAAVPPAEDTENAEVSFFPRCETIPSQHASDQLMPGLMLHYNVTFSLQRDPATGVAGHEPSATQENP